MKKIALLILALCFLAPAARAEDDFQYWSRFSIKALDTKYVDYVNYWELQFTEDVSKTGFWFTSQKLEFDFIKHLQFAAAYTYGELETANRARTTNEFKQQHRLELETNPYWNWEHLKLKNRNRMEFRWIEDKGSDNARFRHLWEAEVPLKKMGPLQGVYTNEEIFADFQEHQIAEHRWTPFGLNFKLIGKAGLKIFYMVQFKKGPRDWNSNQVLGTQVTLSF